MTTTSITDSAHLLRVARQHVETSRLLGVDFLPRRAGSHALVAAAVATGHQNEETIAMPSRPSAASVRAVPAASGSRQTRLEALHAEHDAHCPHCTSVTAHTRTVFGDGNPDAALMFIGEAPGEEEDRTGIPFVGRAGQKLNDIIQAMGLQREEVYIANVLKSRPPNNRTPQPDEVEKCSPYLAEQIRIIRPRVIVTLGGPATKLMLDTKEGITRLRGSWGTYADGDLEIPIMPTFHPAYLLRNYTQDTRKKVWSDMQAVMARLGMAGEKK